MTASEYGLLIDYTWCTGCHSCEMACSVEHDIPIGQFGIRVDQFGPWEIEPDKWSFFFVPTPTDLCDLCAERTSKGKKPTCVHHCQANCMEFGRIEELAKKLGEHPKQVLYAL